MQKSEETAGSGTAPQGLGDTEVVRLVDETAKVLLDEHELRTEVAIWVRRGKVIRDYALKLQPDGKYHKPDPYVLLSEHPDIRWSADQLRNFVDAVELWEQIGEGQPSLPLTFYVIVASWRGTLEEKKALLRRAVDERLKTREVKRAVAGDSETADGEGERVAEGPAAGTPEGDWKKVVMYAEKLYGEVSSVSIADLPHLGIIHRLKEVAAKISALVAKFDKGDGM